MAPRWVVVENVPGLLSSAKGGDFAAIVGTLERFGYCVSWRVLDSQYFGVPQRRRRVFVVGSLGNAGSLEVLFEREGSAGDSQESREKGKAIANGIVSRALTACRTGTGRLDPNGETVIIAASVKAASPSQRGAGSYPTPGDLVLTPWDGERARIISEDGIAPTLMGRDEGSQQPAYVAFDLAQITSGINRTRVDEGLPASTLNQVGQMHVAYNWQSGGDCRLSPGLPNLQANQTPAVGVRRLTPTECERLQGFPDGWTEGLSDSARYRCLGNAVTVSVAEWIGRRIVDANPT
jgi:DNA (cytosine-5)-methyltransferase 1